LRCGLPPRPECLSSSIRTQSRHAGCGLPPRPECLSSVTAM